MSTTTTTPGSLSLWNIDAVHSHLQFSVRHLMISNVKGVFSKLKGQVRLDEQDFTRSQIEVEVETASVDTREPQRDAHLRSGDFLEAEKYPLMTFRSTSIAPRGEEYTVIGDLTLRGVTREIRLAVEAPGPAGPDPWGKVRRGFTAAGELNRKDFGLEYNQVLEAGGMMVGDKVKIALEVELVKE